MGGRWPEREDRASASVPSPSSGVLAVRARLRSDGGGSGSGAVPLDHIAQPVLNRPHAEPSRHWQLAEDNTSTGVAVQGRRPSQSLTIVPKVRDPQLRMDMVPPQQNELVNRIRAMVKRWRDDKYPGATAATRQLLLHWRSEANEPRLFFAQVEAAETLIWLTEANASRYPALAEFRRVLAGANGDYNGGIHRLAVRMATGSGKTAVMGMVVAWHAVNAGRVAAQGRPLHHAVRGDDTGPHRPRAPGRAGAVASRQRLRRDEAAAREQAQHPRRREGAGAELARLPAP